MAHEFSWQGSYSLEVALTKFDKVGTMDLTHPRLKYTTTYTTNVIVNDHTV